jgi:hypothetical protein
VTRDALTPVGQQRLDAFVELLVGRMHLAGVHRPADVIRTLIRATPDLDDATIAAQFGAEAVPFTRDLSLLRACFDILDHLPERVDESLVLVALLG